MQGPGIEITSVRIAAAVDFVCWQKAQRHFSDAGDFTISFTQPVAKNARPAVRSAHPGL